MSAHDGYSDEVSLLLRHSSFVKKGGKEGRRKGDFMLYVALIWSSSRGAKTGGRRSGAERSAAARSAVQ